MNDKLFSKLKQSYSYIGLADDVLKSHADLLAALGFVTEENIDDVVSKQKAFLEGLQKYNDSRVTTAVQKASEKALKDAEEKAKKEKEELEKKLKEDALKNIPEGVKELLDSLKREREADAEKAKAEKEAADRVQKEKEEAWQKTIDELKGQITDFKAEADKRAKEEALRVRKDFIISKAKELGIPQSRIDEGFVIADDATDEAINTYLSTVATNIKARSLPFNHPSAITNDAVKKEEVDAIAEGMVKQLS